MLHRLFSIDDAWLWTTLDLSVKATLLLAIAAVVALLWGRNSAALRHRVWALSFVALLLLPFAGLLLPGLAWQIIPQDWRVAADARQVDRRLVQAPPAENAAKPPTEAAQASPPLPLQPGPQATEMDRAMRSDLPSPSPQVSPQAELATTVQIPEARNAPQESASHSASWIKTFWFFGTLIVLLPLLAGIVGNLILKLRSQHVVDPVWQDLLDDLRKDLDLRRAVTLLLASEGQMPMTFGFFRPVVVLPADAPAWSVERRRVVLLHELAHIKRFDVPWQMIARVACAIYWFHPLAWWALRRMRIDREHACDDCVLAAGQRASSYATHLLEIARVHRSPSPLANAALSMARRSQLEGRLLAVLDAHRARSPLGRSKAIALLFSAMFAVVGLGVIRPGLKAESTALTAATTSDEKPSTTTDENAPNNDEMFVKGVVLSPQGEPVAAAQIEFLSMSDNSGWPFYRPKKQKIEYRQVSTDASGRFTLTIPRPAPSRFPALWALVSAEGLAPSQHRIDPKRFPQEVELKLAAPKTIRVQLVDSIGEPVVGIEPKLWYADSPNYHEGFRLSDPDARELVKLWPKWTVSDAEGYTSAVLPDGTRDVDLLVEDERFGTQIVHFKIADEPIAVMLGPVLQVTGKVVAADTGEPIAGALVQSLDRPHRRTATKADGTFALANSWIQDRHGYTDDERRLQVYPPADSPYLFHSVRYKRPENGVKTVDVPIKLSRGVMIEGQIIERDTRRPVAGASLYSKQQQYANLSFKEGSSPWYTGTEMKYASDGEGRFRMPVWPGPGYLLVQAPTIDYLHVMVSTGDKYYGKPGLQREYHDGALKIMVKKGETPEPVIIELDRGMTLERKVLRPDGKPASGRLYARSYLADTIDISNSMPSQSIERGLIQLPGFAPKESNPLFLIDLEHHCGLTVAIAEKEVDLAAPPIQLLPCGSVKFRFLDDKGQPRAGYEPWLILIITPGALSTHHYEPNQPLWNDNVIWQNVTSPAKQPKTDAEGRVTIDDLIPGATYSLLYVKGGNWTQSHDFTVESNKTIDMGDVVLPEPE